MAPVRTQTYQTGTQPYFNKHQKASQLDIPEATYLISKAWEERPQRVTSHCWVIAGLLPCLDKNYSDYTVKPFEGHMNCLKTGTRIEINSLSDLDCKSQQMEDATDRYLGCDDDTNPSILASIVLIPELVLDLANKS